MNVHIGSPIELVWPMEVKMGNPENGPDVKPVEIIAPVVKEEVKEVKAEVKEVKEEVNEEPKRVNRIIKRVSKLKRR